MRVRECESKQCVRVCVRLSEESRAGVCELQFNFYKLQNLIENLPVPAQGRTLCRSLSLALSLAYYLFLYVLRVCVCCFSDFRQFVERVFVYCNLTDLFGNPAKPSCRACHGSSCSSCQVNSEA